MTKSRHILLPRRPWTPSERAELRRRYKTESAAEIAIAMGRSLSAVYQETHKLGLRKSLAVVAQMARERSARLGHGGVAHRFQKGRPPWNAGIKGSTGTHPNCVRTQFRKGNVSKRWDPEIYQVGALRLNSDGGIDMKVRPGGYIAGNPVWVQLHRWTWERVHGPIPSGMVVRARDGDLHNTQIENLYLASRRDLMAVNMVHNLPKPLARAIQLRGALNRKINRIIKEHRA